MQQRDDSGTAYASFAGWGEPIGCMGHPQESLRHVIVERMLLLQKSNDRFGLAYSFCGQSKRTPHAK